MRNISVKLYKIYTSGSGGDAIKNIFLSTGLATILFRGAEPFRQFW